jgi:hypothetical protein
LTVRHLIELVGFIALMSAACGGAAPSPSSTASPSAGPTITRVTFDGQACKYDGPATVARGTKLVFVFENTPAAIAGSTSKGAITVGSDLVVVEATAGTSLDTVNTTTAVPAGAKVTRPSPPAWAVNRAAYGIGPSATVTTTATGAAYYIGCHEYWDKAFGSVYAAYPAAVIEVLKG